MGRDELGAVARVGRRYQRVRPSVRRPLSSQRSTLALFKLQMRPGETIGDYSRRFEDHMRSADMLDSERGAATYFLSTLPHALRYHIDTAIGQLEEPEPTIKQLISIAQSFTWKPSGG